MPAKPKKIKKEEKISELILPVYNLEGEKVGEEKLPASIFGIEGNPGLIHEAVVAAGANKRQVLAHIKHRGDVRGGGKKPWKQKGTGRARHGSTRSPIWIGGGAIFGPTDDRNFSLKINKKVKRNTLLMALSEKVKNNQIILLEKLDLPEIKTKKVVGLMKVLAKKIKMELNKGLLIVLPVKNEKIEKSVNNIPKMNWLHANNLNILDVLRRPYFITSIEGVKKIEEIYAPKKK